MENPEPFDPYQVQEGIWRGPTPVLHREEDYPSEFFPMLFEMERKHFWYRGRYRFLLWSVRKYIHCLPGERRRIIDLGGGGGEWIRRLAEEFRTEDIELALGDSSLQALQWAKRHTPPQVQLYHVDCMHLNWKSRWEGIFLLDVLEHLPDDLTALQEVCDALTPGGLVWCTVPALQAFWSYNDEIAKHRRRYNRTDLARLAEMTHLELVDTRYFMFFLSPLVWIARWIFRPRKGILSANKAVELLKQTHQAPHPLINAFFTAIFALETPLGHRIHFPWGTSLLGIFRKPM